MWWGSFSTAWVWKGLSLCVLRIFPEFFKKYFIWKRMRAKELSKGDVGLEKRDKQATTWVQKQRPGLSQDTEIMTWTRSDTWPTEPHRATEGSFSKEVGLGPLPLQGLEKGKESIKTGSGRGRKELGGAHSEPVQSRFPLSQALAQAVWRLT